MNLVDPDGEYIIIFDNDIRYDWQKNNGRWGLYDYDGNKYSGSNKFINQVGSALNELMASGETGYNLIETLSNLQAILRIYNLYDVQDRGYNGTCHVNGDIVWDADNPESVPTTKEPQSNAIINLGHELAHVKYRFENGPEGDWFHDDLEKPVPISEIYTTHYENKIRAEMGQPLRTHYAKDENENENENGNGIGKPIIHPRKRASIYYDAFGYTTYEELSKNILPFIY